MRTDKCTSHNYIPIYEKYFKILRKKKLSILEIGIGGHNDPFKGAKSLRMWKYYFPRSIIYGLDINDKSVFNEKRIVTFKGSQADGYFLKKVIKNIGELDIIIDDGSHMNEHVLFSFETLFPFLKCGGVYIIEDCQTSYWPDFGGDSNNLNNLKTTMGYFKNLVGCVNYKEILKNNYTPSIYDKYIVKIHFYHNLIVIVKNNNDEESNAVINNILI